MFLLYKFGGLFLKFWVTLVRAFLLFGKCLRCKALTRLTLVIYFLWCAHEFLNYDAWLHDNVLLLGILLNS